MNSLEQENNFLKSMIRDYYKPEIERLNKELQDTKEHLGELLHKQEKENKRLNNIINEIEKWLGALGYSYGISIEILNKIKELKGDK